MRQSRVKSGKEFEDSISEVNWLKKPKSPKFRWNGNGRNNFEKIVNSGYNPDSMYLLPDTDYGKWDLISKEDPTKTADAKRYNIGKLRSWTLYSEPYFKVAIRHQIKMVDKDKYNKFVNEFYNINENNGTFDIVLKNMIKNSIGIVTLDGFIPIEDLEFRTVIVKTAWKGFDRITIQFRLKS